MKLTTALAISLALHLAVLAGCAPPEELTATFKDGTKITLRDEPCTAKDVLQHVPPKNADGLKAGSVFWEGKLYGLCWKMATPDTVAVVDSDGSSGFISVAEFAKTKS